LHRKIDHVAIAVRSLQSALKAYSDALGLSDWSVEDVPDQKTRVAFLPIGESRIELLEAAAEDSPVAGFIAKRGEGLHHICIQVQNLEAEMERLRAGGVRLVDQNPRVGAGGCRIAFIHPSSTAGVLIELSQPPSLTTTHTTSE
jgi:methylmalonyl-CoA/ethylmalonyl-CoA epimerase